MQLLAVAEESLFETCPARRVCHNGGGLWFRHRTSPAVPFGSATPIVHALVGTRSGERRGGDEGRFRWVPVP